MTGFIEAAALGGLKDGVLRAVWPLGLPVLLVRKGGSVFAVENRCAHMGCPLTAGSLEGYILTCPCHDWRFDVRDGIFLEAPELRIKSYPVKIEGEKILIQAEL